MTEAAGITGRPPIAVVGVGAIFPGAQDAGGFWHDIANGVDRIRDVPPTHWLIDDYYDPDPKAPDKTYCKRGAFLDPVAFDPLAFGIPPNTIPATDTAQLLALMVAKRVLEEASRARFGRIDKQRTSVILGVASATELVVSMGARLQRPIWAKALRESGLSDQDVDRICDRIAQSYVPWQESTFPGLLGNVVAGRIANRLDLGGSNSVIDAACASSFAAVAAGVNELHLGLADLAIVGGVDALNDILMYMCFSKTPALSPTGDCRPFSDAADGTILGEGLGMVALRRLADAERDGNHIYAVIRGVGASSDGQATSVYAPRPEGQAVALERAYLDAGYGPRTVELVEAHGTATRAGDLAEFTALTSVFAADSGDRQWCALGSIKSQIGHTKAAAGAAGLLKAVLALNQKVIPPTIKVERPATKLPFPESPFYLSTKARPWIADRAHPRRASVSSFGFGGSNFHVTLEEYTGEAFRAPRHRGWSSELILLSAESRRALADACAMDVARRGLAAIARDSQQRFDAGAPVRLAIVADSRDELQSRLRSVTEYCAGSGGTALPLGCHLSMEAAAGRRGLVYLFPGQGSQYPGMGADLAMAFEAARGVWDAEAVAPGDACGQLHRLVFPPPAFDDVARNAQMEALTVTSVAQPAIAATSLSMLAVLNEIGLAPDAIAGHSSGEVTALCAAGAFAPEALVAIARKRGELMAAASRGDGAMAAVAADRDRIRKLLSAGELPVVIANDNSPEQVVLSGPTDAVERALELVAREGLTGRRLPVASGFHSAVVADSVMPFREYLAQLGFTAPAVPVYANSTAALYPAAPEAMRDLLAGQIAAPVRFRDVVEAMYEAGIRDFLEVGPGNVLTGLVRQCLKGRDFRAIALDRRGGDGIRALWSALGELATLGHKIDFGKLWEGFVVDDRPSADAGKHAIAISGVNYAKPYPPQGSAARRQGGRATDPESARVAPAPRGRSPLEPAPPPPAADASASPVSAPETMPPPTLPAAPVTSELWTAAHLAVHRQAAEAHATFQRLMAESHQAYLDVVAGALQSLSGKPSAADGDAPPSDAPPPETSIRSPHRAVEIQPMAPPPVAPRSTPVEAPVAVPALVSAPGDVSAVLMEIVAAKTGYPPDMLQPAMELEADLGIDSIKQVEILSALRDRLPGLPEVEPGQLAELRSLERVIAFIESGIASAAESRDPLPASPPPSPSAPAMPAADAARVLFEVVAEKTGYPVELLGPDMDLAADLGIDSIKQVEILSTLCDRLPGLPEVEPVRLAELGTLQRVVAFMEAGAAASGGHAPATPLPANPPAPPSGAAEPAVADPGRVLFEIVAEKTGYPVELLGPDMDLAADLGIDSIKQVEILSALRDRLPGLPALEPARLGELRTLRAIAGYLARQPSAVIDAVPTAAVRDAIAGRADSGTVGRHTLQAVSAPLPGARTASLGQGDRVEIVADVDSIAHDMAKAFGERGLCAHVVDQAGAEADAVVYLGGLRDTGDPEDNVAIHREAFVAARTVAPRFARDGGTFVTVQDTGGCFGLDGMPAARAWLGGLPGLIKTAAAEWPKAELKAIDIERRGRGSAVIARALVDEILDGGSEKEVGLKANGRRLTLGTRAAPAVHAGTPVIDGSSVLVVSGGARGITAAALRELLREAGPRCVVLGRSEAAEESPEFRAAVDEAALRRAVAEEARHAGLAVTPPQIAARATAIVASREIRANLEAMHRTGAAVRYVPVDIRDRRAVAKALAGIRAEWGPITGIVHGAGTLADKLIADKTVEQFDNVFRTKVVGLASLLDACEADPLRLICVFSSVAARAGNAGQCDYAMANEVLNKVARAEAERRNGSCVVKAINWGPWDGGMVTSTLRRLFQSRGVPLISLDAGARFFVREIMGGPGGDVEVLAGSGPHAGGAMDLPSPGLARPIQVSAST